ncbi:MAG: peptidoglycan DD-metalloendopeptidase family protein [Bacteroidales bacterium]|nr:peptidoglycan DD-metalloendopeptidase family protein [Bacteroidales bacterium]
MTKLKYFLFVALLLSLTGLYAQQDENYSHNMGGDGPLIDSNSETEIDTLGFYLEDDENDNFSDNSGQSSMLFTYFDWMPGYGIYENFDVISTHYRPLNPVKADTLLLNGYCHPAKFRVTSNFGRRKRRMHYGIDLGYPTGTPVVAAFDGIVRISKGNAGGYGNLVVIRHYNKLETYYAHLSKRLVNPGQMVHAGDTIGLGGNTGRSYGSHLHFETRYLGTPFNPTKIIDFNNYQLLTDTLYIAQNAVKIQTPTEAEKRAIAAASQQSKSSGSSGSSGKVYHKIRKGETLSTIARKYHTSVSAIKRLNGMKSDFIREGKSLRVR